jgi:NADH-quinone oxidoreductase subunit F
LDLHLTDARPSTEEQAAVDAALGLGARDMLLPVLHASQMRAGWVSPGAVNYIAVKLHVPPAEVFSVASFYGMITTKPRSPTVLHVCDDIACHAAGAGKVCAELERTLGPAGGKWKRNGCLGLCERAPAALLHEAGERPREEQIAPVDAQTAQAVLAGGQAPAFDLRLSAPQAGQPQLRLLARAGVADPESLSEYQAHGGYRALEKALRIGAPAVVREVTASRLTGRGGAAFPTGRKWESVAAAGGTRYLVCNADESEPGTFKDRVLKEADPFAVVESMTIAGFATGAVRGYLYIRGEYPLAVRRMQHAIDQARAHGLLGDDILGSGASFDIEVRRGAGAYICGEETAMFNSIEGYRGEPRNKPPFPTEAGLFGRPTLVNNVETLLNVPWIVLDGGEAFARMGTAASTGTKLFCVCGHVARPGVYEYPFGILLREVIERAGGVAGSGKLQAVLLGGAAGGFLSPGELDVPLTFEGTRAIGASLGSGVVMLFDDTVDMRRILLRIAEFFREESCGQCVPCRVGTARQVELLERVFGGRPHGSMESEMATLGELGQAMRDASICGLGQTATSAVESAMRRWGLPA